MAGAEASRPRRSSATRCCIGCSRKSWCRTSSSSAWSRSRAAACCGNSSRGSRRRAVAAVAGHRGDGAPVLQHRIRARGIRRGKRGGSRHCAPRSRRRGRRASPVPLHWYALYACYRPLHTLDAADAIAADLAPTALASLALRQIREPQEERRIRGTIAALTDVVDGVSAAVRSQYEANPYPRWLRLGRDIAPSSVAAFLRSHFPGRGSRRDSRRARANSRRGLRHRTASDRHGAAIPGFERARRGSQPDEPRLRGAQDARARNRQHRVPAGGHPGAGSADRALRRRRLHRRAASPRGSGRRLADTLLAAASRRHDAHRTVQRDRAPARRSRARVHRGGRLSADARRHSRLPRRDSCPTGRRAARARRPRRGFLQPERLPRPHLPRPGAALQPAAGRRAHRGPRSANSSGSNGRIPMPPARYRARFPEDRALDRSRPTGIGSKRNGPTRSC